MADIILTFRFDGGDAEDHQLDIYDAARFQYGAARFIYTLEVLRQKGKVPQRIVRDSIKADFRIGAAEPRCFLQSVIAVAAPVIADTYIKVSIEQMIAFAFETMFPRKLNDQAAAELAVALSEQETERWRLMLEKDRLNANERSELIACIRELAHSARVPEERRIDASKIVANDEAAEVRARLIAESGEEFQKVSYENKQELIAINRRQMSEMGLPLKRSADTLSILTGSTDEPIRQMDLADVVYLEGNKKDDEPTEMVGTIKSWDKETGWGKWRNADQGQPISFLVRARDRETVKDRVLDKMKENELWVRFIVVRDPNRVPKYMVFDSFVGEEGEDD